MLSQGTGYSARLFRQFTSVGVPCTALHMFVYEGDNRADAAALAAAVCNCVTGAADPLLASRSKPAVTFPGHTRSVLWDDADSSLTLGGDAPVLPWVQPVVELVQPVSWEHMNLRDEVEY